MANTENEISITSINEVIDKQLVEQNITKSIIANLKEKYGSLKLSGLDDKESYIEIKTARQDCKKIRVLAEKICKKGREKSIAEQKAWIAKEKEVTGEIAEIEDALEVQEKAYEAEQDKIKAEKKKKQDENFILRQSELTQFGAIYMDGFFVLEDVSYEAVLLREADEDIYATMREQYKAIFDKREASRLEAEQKQADAARLLAEERAELERIRAEQQAQADKLKAEADRLQQLKEQAEAAEKAEAEKKERERREIELSRFQSRLSQLKGYNYDGVNVSFEGAILGTMDDMIRIPAELFDAMVEAHNKLLAEREEEQKAFEAANAAREAKQSKRIAQLYELGLKFDFNGGYFVNFDVFIHTIDIQTIEDKEWEDLIVKTAAHIKAYKEREEEKKNAEAQAKQDAAIAEALAIAQREAAEKQEKELAEKQRLEAEETEKRNQSSDKAKWQHAKEYFIAYPWPEFASGQYKKKMNDTKTYHQQL